MKPANLLRKPSAWALGLGFLLAMAGCEDRVAGSSVTTGNPTEIQVSFTGENGPVALSGKVEIYGATQIPVPGFRPEPLKSFDVGGQKTFTLSASSLDGIADSLWAPGSLEGDSLARFNLIISAPDRGSIIRDIVLRLKDDKFSLKEGTYSAGPAGSVKVQTEIVPFAAYQVSLDSLALSSRRHNYLFLYGTGWHAEDSVGTFRFPSLPNGSHRLSFVAIPTKESQAQSPTDSVNVYGLDKPVEAGSNTVVRGEAETRIPIPSSLR